MKDNKENVIELEGGGRFINFSPVKTLTLLADLLAKQEGKKGITLPAIGKVKLIKRPARTGRNPATGETIKIKAKTVVKIVACKALKDAILG